MDVRPGYKQTEVGVIPREWESTTVRDIASSVRNAIVGGPFGSDLVSNDYVEDGVPVLRGQNMGRRFVSGSFAFVTRAKASSLEANLARPGDLVFTQRGTLGQVSLVPDQPYDRYLVSQSQMKLTVNRRAADPLFFYYVFSSAEQQEFIRKNTIQTGVPHINLGILRAILVQRPSLAEQEAIAEALGDADAHIDSLEQLLVKKRQLKQGTMQELLTGAKRLPGFSREWELKRLGEVCRLIVDGTHFTPRYVESGVPFYSVENVTASDFTNTRFISAEEHSRLVKRCKPERGDILLTRIGSIGDTKLIDWDVEASIYVSLALLKVNDRIDAGYLYWYSKCRQFVKDMEDRSLMNASPKKINMGDIGAVPVSVPDLSEQRAIAAILSDMDAEIAMLEAKLAKARQIKWGMMQELLTGRIRLV